MENSFDYGTTGASDSAGGHFAQITKEGKFAIKKEVIGSSITGRLESVDVRYAKANGDIPARWELWLYMELRDDVRGILNEAANMRLARYIVVFNQNSRILTHNVINTLLATDLNWNNWLKLDVYQTNEKNRVSVKTDPSQGNGMYAPLKFPFSMELRGYEGCPQPIETTFIDAATGKPKLDNREVDNFWLIQAKELFRKINGRECTSQVYCCPEKYVYANGFGDATYEADMIEKYLGRKRHEGAAPTPPPAAQTNAPTAVDKYWIAVDKAISSITNIDSANTAYDNAKKHLPSGVAIGDVTNKISAKLNQLAIGYIFGAEGYTAVPSAPPGSLPDAPPPGGMDDLPF